MSGLFQDPQAPEDDPPPPPEGPGLFGDALPEVPPPATPAPAYRVLARKYRPTVFADLIGQDAMVRTLRNAFAAGRIAHAFMLTGVRGVGKTTTARIIARCLNCSGPDETGAPRTRPTAEPCGVCADCRAILADRHPDVIEMDAASRTGVDDVREIIEATRFRPMQARTKVFIIDEVHMLSRNAFNALLKTLEEPPPHVVFVFATTELRKVPITVLSRCQRFDLRRVRIAELAALFSRIATAEHVAAEPEALDLIARAADGSVRDGLSMLDQAIAQRDQDAEGPIAAAQVAEMLGLADREAVFDLLDAVMAGKPAAALALTERAYERGADLGLLLADLLDLIHSITRLKSIPDLRQSQELPEAERTRGAALADRLSVPTLARAWQMLLKGVGEVEFAPDRRAAAEMVLIRLCHVAELPTPGDLVRRLGVPGTSGAPAADSGPRAAPRSDGATALAAPAPDAAPAPVLPRANSFRAVVALIAEQREALLHAHLVHSVRLVRFAPPVIELRPLPEAPRDLAPKLAAALLAATGTRWTIALSTEAGDGTLAEQGNAADASRRADAAEHKLVRAILEAFPGARIEAVHDSRTDPYGLPAEPAEMPAFAPPDAEPADGEVPDDPDMPE